MKNKKFRKLLGYLISILPTNNMRVFLYKYLFGYDIQGSKIGWRTVIIVEDAQLIECNIQSRNTFIGPMKIVLKKGSYINNNNKFLCGDWTKKVVPNVPIYKRNLEIGENSRVSKNNYFDVAGSIILGNNSWIAGRDGQFWTHGASATKRDILIGNNCYIGSAVRIAPGSSIGNNTIVGLGSVITKEFTDENVILGGQPAKVIRKNYNWRKSKLSSE